jgi:hypothetical protein
MYIVSFMNPYCKHIVNRVLFFLFFFTYTSLKKLKYTYSYILSLLYGKNIESKPGSEMSFMVLKHKQLSLYDYELLPLIQCFLSLYA